MDDTTKIFIDNLRAILKERNMTQYELARSSGLSCAAINNYLLGKNRPLLTQAILICNSLDVSLDVMCECSCIDKVDKYSFTSKELQKIADIYYSLNVKGRNSLLSVSESLSLNPDLLLNNNEKGEDNEN